jgi:hypothetical protein
MGERDQIRELGKGFQMGADLFRGCDFVFRDHAFRFQPMKTCHVYM